MRYMGVYRDQTIVKSGWPIGSDRSSSITHRLEFLAKIPFYIQFLNLYYGQG
jgi:hypothetical protein